METNFLAVKTEEEKNADNGKWYTEYAKFILSRYNTQTSIDSNNLINEETGGNVASFSPIEAIRRNFSYFANKQDNKQFGFITQDNSGEALDIGVVWQRVPRIQQLVNDFVGDIQKSMKYYDMYVYSVSPSAQNEKTNKLGLTRLKQQNNERFKALEELGVVFSPLGDIEEDFDSIDDIESFIENDYKTPLEIYADIIKKDILDRNDYITYCDKALKYATIAGIIATEIRKKNGKVYWHIYMPDRIIWDNSVDTQHHKDIRYIGLIDYMTPSEIIETWGEELRSTDEGIEALEKLKQITTDRGVNGDTGFNTTLPLTSRSNNIPLITVVKNYWKALKKTEEEQYDTYYQCVQIADIITVEKKEVENLVENYKDRKVVYPPVSIWTPEVVQGEAHSLVGRMIHNADLIDFYKNRINQRILQSKGRVAIIVAENLGSKGMVEITNDWERMGATVINRQNPLDYEAVNSGRFAEVLDFSNTQEIQMLVSILDREEQMMERITNATDITLGEQQQYVSTVTQGRSIEQSKKGVFGFYEGFLKHIEHLTLLSVNIQKDLVADENNNYAIPLLSRFGQDFLKKIRNITLEDFNVSFKFLDPITEAKSQAILTYIERKASDPNSGFTDEDFANAISFRTLTQLQKYFKKITRRQKKEREEQAMLAAQQQQQAIEAKNNTDIEKANVSAGGVVEAAEIKAEADLAKEAMKS